MATVQAQTLNKEGFENWIKGVLAVRFAKEGLVDFVEHEIADFQRNLMQKIYIHNGISPGTTCCLCTTANVLDCPTDNFCSRTKTKRCKAHDSKVPDKKPKQGCLLCTALRDAIRNEHRYNGPSWKNTDARRWCSDAFEICKCFMPQNGYSDKTCLAKTDFNGIINVIINNKLFDMKMSVNLSGQPNMCTEARKIGHNIRHSADHLLSDQDLTKYIDDLITLLSDPTYLVADAKAKDAVEKLKQLKMNTLTVNANDIKVLLTEEDLATLSEQHNQLMEAIQNIKNDTALAIEHLFALIWQKIDSSIVLQEMKRPSRGTIRNEMFPSRVLKDLKRNLIKYYQTRESTISVSPLVESNAVPLKDLYVQPPMLAFNKPHHISQGYVDMADSKQWAKTSSFSTQCKDSLYRWLLFDNENNPYKNVYISAPAGSGKTSFSKQIAITWCEARSTIYSKHANDDLKVLKTFSYLFLIHLRDFQGISNVEDMILKMIGSKLPRSDKYSEKLIQTILREKKCLIVLDGLDEWSHPNNSIPELKCYPTCTTLTTTRPWKLSTVGLKSEQIDRRVEITSLDIETMYKLGDKALRILQSNNCNNLHDFLDKMFHSHSKDILTIPYVLLQFICLWNDGHEIGRTKCEIYSNMTDFILERGLKITRIIPNLIYLSSSVYTVPKCMINSYVCKKHMHLLIKLGKLAFSTLFDENKPSTLVFDTDTVRDNLGKEELEFFLKIGLLSQTKDDDIVSKESLKVFFYHKSIHEFFAALFISSTWQNEATKELIRKSCRSVRDILEFSGVVSFVCGIDRDVYLSLSRELDAVVANDKGTQLYRQQKNEYGREMLLSYQSRQVSCLQENYETEKDQIAIPLQDVFVDENRDDFDMLNAIAKYNKDNVKSVTKSNELLVEKEMLPILTELGALESLFWEHGDYNFLADILAGSARSLKYISIDNVIICNSITDRLTSLRSLLRITLGYSNQISHSDIDRLCVYLGKTLTLRQIRLELECNDHGWSCTGFLLDLSKLSKLQKIQVTGKRPFPYGATHIELHVNTDSLLECEIHAGGFSDRTTSTFLAELQGAPRLLKLTVKEIKHVPDMLINTIPTLLHLENLTLERTSMTDFEWKELIYSVTMLLQSITVNIKQCDGPSKEQWVEIENLIRESRFPLIKEIFFEVEKKIRIIASVTFRSQKSS